MKPFFPVNRQKVLTAALLGALAINTSWKLASSTAMDFASSTAELEKTVATSDGVFKAKYYVIGTRTTVRLEAMDGGAQCEVCNTYDLEGVVLDKSNEKSIADVNVALMRQIEQKKKPAATVKETAKPERTEKAEPKKALAADEVLDECSGKKGDSFTFCAVNVITSLSSKNQDDREIKSQIEQLYKKHVRRNLLKMIADHDSTERAEEGFDTAKQMIEDLYPSNAKGVIEDLTSLVAKGMAAQASSVAEKYIMSRQIQRTNPEEAMMLLQEFQRDRGVFAAQIRSVQAELFDSLTSHSDDGFSSSAARNMLMKNYNIPVTRVRDILWGNNPEQLTSANYLDADLRASDFGGTVIGRSGRNTRNGLGRLGSVSSLRGYDTLGTRNFDTLGNSSLRGYDTLGTRNYDTIGTSNLRGYDTLGTGRINNMNLRRSTVGTGRGRF